jgi:hypothetical protein
MTAFTPISIIPIEQFRDQEPTTFREVVAYLHGVADAFAARIPVPRALSIAPLALAPLSLASPHPSSRAPAPTRITLRFGELPSERASVWPHVVVGGDWEATRGGARTIDLAALESSRSSFPVVRRGTLPYEAPRISLTPRASIPPSWADERSSEVRLRATRLPVEWYELTGTDGGTFEPASYEAANA